MVDYRASEFRESLGVVSCLVFVKSQVRDSSVAFCQIVGKEGAELCSLCKGCCPQDPVLLLGRVRARAATVGAMAQLIGVLQWAIVSRTVSFVL